MSKIAKPDNAELILDNINSELDNVTYENLLDFKVLKQNDVSIEILQYVYLFPNRHDTIVEFLDYLNLEQSKTIELSILEASLLKFIDTGCGADMLELFEGIYKSIKIEILVNIDPFRYENNVVNNSLLTSILDGTIDLTKIAFLKPWEINPLSWKNPLMKRQILEDVYDNEATTDIYTCGRCGSKKFKTVQIQTRSADEGVTTFVMCTVCRHKFRK